MINPFRKLKYIRYYAQRLKGDLPACDCWDYKYTLVKNIEQGLTFLLEEGMTDWDAPVHQQEKKELEYVLNWARTFPVMNLAIIVDDLAEKQQKMTEVTDRRVVTKREWAEWEKQTQKAFAYLAKNIYTLWDQENKYGNY